MVARGDMGVEIPVEEVIFAQKNDHRKMYPRAQVVITATQMLDSSDQETRVRPALKPATWPTPSSTVPMQ